MKKLLNILLDISPLTPTTLDHLASRLTLENIDKKDVLSSPGAHSPFLYLISEGSIREFFIDQKGNDISTWFGFENDIAVCLSSFLSKTPSYTGLQALEQTKLYKLNRNDLFEMYELFPDMERLGRIITEHYFIESEHHHYSFRHLNASERYNELVKRQPQIIQRVPLSHIASYLGISLETLSRIRSKNL